VTNSGDAGMAQPEPVRPSASGSEWTVAPAYQAGSGTPATAPFAPVAPGSVPPPPPAPALAPAHAAPAAGLVAAPSPVAAPSGAAVGLVPAPVNPAAPVATTPASPAAAVLAELPGSSPSGQRGTETDASSDSGLLSELLIEMIDRKASDLHLTAGAPPTIRLNGSLRPLEGRAPLTPPILQRMLFSLITQRQRETFEAKLELDFAYALPGKGRFRVNLYRQRDALGAAFRVIPYEIKPLEELGVPNTVASFSMLSRGFVLVTGPTGSGKSTTLASIVDMANRQRHDHIMTVEDPIEFLHSHKNCLINQREVGEDTHSFQNALKHVLRQDPDIILVGEMRDLETISVALTAAETGHLVFATLHTSDAAQTIDRVIDVFPPHQQQQIRVQLASALQGVVCQTLCKTYDGQGRVVAAEVLVATPAIRNLIREGKTHQIYSAMQAGAKHGMQTMDQHLAELVKRGKISLEVGIEKCHHIEDFNRLCGRA
jgi:twitching motility protein PilT